MTAVAFHDRWGDFLPLVLSPKPSLVLESHKLICFSSLAVLAIQLEPNIISLLTLT